MTTFASRADRAMIIVAQVELGGVGSGARLVSRMVVVWLDFGKTRTDGMLGCLTACPEKLSC